MPNSRGIMQGRHNAAYYVSPSIPWKKYFIGCIMIKLINLTAYVNKTPSINRIAQKWQSILTSSTDGQFPIWPNAGTMVASGGVCSFVAMTAKPHNPDTSSMYRTPVKRNKNIICSPKKLPMNNPMTSFSKCKEYHSILYIVTIENNKLYVAATTRKNRIAFLEMNKIFIKLPIAFYLTCFHQYALFLLFHLFFFRYEICIFFHACNLVALWLCYLH